MFPLRAASIDVGSNAIRLLVAEFLTPDAYKTIEEERVPVRLGHEVFLSGQLDAKTMDAAVGALRAFRNRVQALEVHRYRAVATSAVRESRNGRDFVERVQREADIHLEPITGSEEARLVNAAVRSRIPMESDAWVLVDLGGGSVEVSLVEDGESVWSESHTMGSVRLLEELQESGGDLKRFERLLTEYTNTLRMPKTARRGEIAGFAATGGNIETLARLGNAPSRGDGVSVLETAELRRKIKLLASLSPRQRTQKLGLRPDRADVILPAAMVYERLASLVGAKEILVPHVGLKEGVLLDLVEDLATHQAHEDRKEQEAFTGALALGRRYQFDEPHAVHVAHLAASLFEQLEELHQLGEEDHRILTVAALLHDMGAFVSHSKHHKHSLYLISESEIPGFSPAEMLLAANVARYHRKAHPAPQHDTFAKLDEKEQERVRRMSALLRIADALDREHLQRVEQVRARVKDGALRLKLEGTGDLLLERWALERKADLFEKLFDLKVEVQAAEP
jgi:exopolyphosphatase/guanosine-5'-triphosphate,3'-diphosphate pyrophosphatase